MPSVNEMFPSKYLKSADLKGREVTVTISHIEIEDLENQKGTERKPVVYFQNKEKGLVLNRTNADAIAQLYGDDTDAWPGREIVLFVMRVQGPQGMTDGIRVRAPAKRNGKPDPGYQLSSGPDAAPVKKQAPVENDFHSDEVPF